MRTPHYLFAALLLALSACGSNQKGPDKTDKGQGPSSGATSEESETTDEQEPNNSSKQANTLEPKKAIKGFIGPVLKNVRDEDWFVIDVGPQKVRAKASLSGIPNIDLSLAFFDGQQNRLAIVNNHAAGEAEVVPVIGLVAGKNYLRVREVDKKGKPPVSDELNQYTLSVELLPDAPEEEVEPNEKRVDSTTLTPGKEYYGYLAWKGDVDWYKIPTTGVEAGSLMRIDFKGVPDVTPQITLYDSIEDKIWGPVTPVKAEEPLTLRNIAVQIGPGFDAYYIAVEAKKGANTDTRYTLAVSFEKGSGETELEPNDDRKRATPIANAQRLSGLLSQGDVDMYKVVADSPAILRVEVDGLENVDLRLEVQNKDGVKIFAVNEGAKKEGEVVPDISIPMGESYIKVTGGKGEFNNDASYVIGVTLTPQDGTMEIEPNNTKDEATEIAPGLTLSGYMFPKGDVDSYRLDLSTRTGPTSLQITATGIPKADLELALLDDTNAVLQSSAKHPAGEDEVLRLTLDPGVYQISIKGKNSNPRDMYQLQVEER